MVNGHPAMDYEGSRNISFVVRWLLVAFLALLMLQDCIRTLFVEPQRLRYFWVSSDGFLSRLLNFCPFWQVCSMLQYISLLH